MQNNSSQLNTSPADFINNNNTSARVEAISIYTRKTIAFFVMIFFCHSITYAQNVGIGTVNPTGRLHLDLNGTANTLAIIIDDDDDPVIRFRRLGISKGFLEARGNDFRLGTYATNDSGKLILATNSTSRMIITPAGNIGIGISEPVSKFQISVGSDASLQSNGYLMLGNVDASNIVFDNNEILARDNGAPATLFLAREGSQVQLGNGTSAANTKLQISAGYDAGLADTLNGYLMMGTLSGSNIVMDNNEIMARSNGNASTLFLQNEGGNVHIGDPANFNGTHRLGVDGNAVIIGALRIGSTVTPAGYKLAVDGRMICTEVMVRLVPNWPDYVFNKNYKLPSISEVESFIQINSHLPGIPSATTLEKEGLSLGEMQKLQMQKIEELTLYIIDINKQLQSVKLENEQIRKQLLSAK
ncbi:MAG: hypothetical protein ABIQ56_06400 [Chitinophagaceae bacterium]